MNVQDIVFIFYDSFNNGHLKGPHYTTHREAVGSKYYYTLGDLLSLPFSKSKRSKARNQDQTSLFVQG